MGLLALASPFLPYVPLSSSPLARFSLGLLLDRRESTFLLLLLLLRSWDNLGYKVEYREGYRIC